MQYLAIIKTKTKNCSLEVRNAFNQKKDGLNKKSWSVHKDSIHLFIFQAFCRDLFIPKDTPATLKLLILKIEMFIFI